MIYGLTNKRGEVRYVGRTKRRLYKRLSGHKSAARTRRTNTPSAKWIRRINPCNVDIILLEENSENEVKSEVWWMDYLEFLGCDLLNEIRYELPLGGPEKFQVTDEVKELMGTIPDHEVAKRFDVCANTIWKYRNKLGIEPDGNVDVTEEMKEMMGTVSDRKVGEKFGLKQTTIGNHRRRLGIEAFGNNGGFDVPEELIEQLGEKLDTELGEEFGFTPSVVRKNRKKRGIDPLRPGEYEFSEEFYNMLGEKPDGEIAEKFEVHVQTVKRRREKENINRYKKPKMFNKKEAGEIKWLIENTDKIYQDIVNEYGGCLKICSKIKNEKYYKEDIESIKPT